MAESASPSAVTHGRRVRLVVAGVFAVVVLVAASILIGRASAPTRADPSDTSAEAGFARDMQVHHGQAVELSFMIRDLTDDADVRLLAYDIATTQSQQAGQMYGWLETWGLSQAASEPSMTWMTRPALNGSTHDHGASTSAHTPGDPMPGLATPEQVAELADLTGVDAERLFLQLMIAHHEGGVEMAEAVLARTTNPIVVELASGMVVSQKSEIELMEQMLAERPALVE